MDRKRSPQFCQGNSNILQEQEKEIDLMDCKLAVGIWMLQRNDLISARL